MGMIVTGLVMSAIAALFSAVAMGWEQSGTAQSDSSQRVHAHARIQRLLRGVKQLGAVRAGSIDASASPAAAILIWNTDANGDDKPQFSELALLVHQGGDLLFYDVAYPAMWTAQQRADADNTDPITHNEIFLDEGITDFLSADYIRATIVTSNVTGALFKRTDGANVTRPSLDYVLKFSKGGSTQVEYGTASVRPPAALPPGQS